MNREYADFLASKLQYASGDGFPVRWMPAGLYDFQQHLVEWSASRGRAAVLADCGLGKTPMQLTWAQAATEATNRHTLILSPLAVAAQTVREGEKFGIECARSHTGELPARPAVVVTNYERLHRFRPSDFGAVVCDESSILKSFNGARRAEVTEFMRTILYRLLCTATAAPNDYHELGTSSEALGELGATDMLARFFVNDLGNASIRSRTYGETRGWRFKGHAEGPFWRWVSSWARACRRPSDLGFPDDGFRLPALIERDHVVETATLPPGMLFPVPATNLGEEREERRRTLRERCEMAASLVGGTGRPAVIWCHLNAEGDMLARLIPDAQQVSGADSDEAKEAAYEAFAAGDLRILIIKPKIGAWGLNWQHCAHVVTFASHSFEQDYQAVRRCWRFGQQHPVTVDRVYTAGEARVRENMRRKAAAADRMFTELVAHMHVSLRIARGLDFTVPMEVPPWL